MFVCVCVNHLEETPLENLQCKDIQVSKPRISGIDYQSFLDRVEYVISVVNKNEYNAATTFISSPDIEEEKTQLTNYESTVYLGMMKHHPVGLIQHGPGRKAAETLQKGLKFFPNVKYVVATGVCYGFDKNEVKYGDVLISKQIEDLGPVRISKNTIESRGPTKDIESVFCTNIGMEGLPVSSNRKAKHFAGKIVSASILIDDLDLKNKIANSLTGKLLGGEMEGGELLQLQEKGVTVRDGSTRKIEVIIIKAVVDYADGKKNKVWQFMAAQAAFNCNHMTVILIT